MQKLSPDGHAPKLQPQPARWWLAGEAVLLVGMIAMLALGVWESRLNVVPLWGQFWTWLWIASPFVGWMAAVWLSHWRRLPSFIVLAGAIVSCVGALAIVLGDVLEPNKPGGMNPYAVQGAGLTFLIVALLQWLLLLPFVVAAAVAWLAARNRRRLG